MSSNSQQRGIEEDVQPRDECSTSSSVPTAEAESGAQPQATATTQVQTTDRETLQKVQSALKNKIQELEENEADEREITKSAKKAVRDVHKLLSSKEHTTDEKLELMLPKFIEKVNEHVKSEKEIVQLQKKLDKVTAERAAMSEEMRKLTAMNSKLQDLCRMLQAQNKNVVHDAQEKATAEAQQREELSQRMETAMLDISSRLEEHSEESQRCMKENMELRAKLEQVGQFCEDLDSNHKEQLERKDAQISFLRDRMNEQSELIEHYIETEKVLQAKCTAAEAASEMSAKQLEDAKERINGFCESFEKSNAAFKQLQEQVEMSHKIQKKMQQESDLLKKRSDLVQQKSDHLMTENEKLLEQVDGMRGKLEHSVPAAEHNKLSAQKGALEKLCRVLQAEIKELRQRLPVPLPTQHPLTSRPSDVESMLFESGDDIMFEEATNDA